MKLDLVWTAILKDGSIIRQFTDEAQTQERLFREVQEQENDLRAFQLTNIRSKVLYTVDLINGTIRIASAINKFGNCLTAAPEVEVSGNLKYKYKLIYFRRITRDLCHGRSSNSDMKDIQYFLGFQFVDENGLIGQKLLQISRDDEVYFA